MSHFYSSYQEALSAAQAQANSLRIPCQIEKTREYGKVGFTVKLAPRPENRYGFEARTEIVEPYLDLREGPQ